MGIILSYEKFDVITPEQVNCLAQNSEFCRQAKNGGLGGLRVYYLSAALEQINPLVQNSEICLKVNAS